MFFYASKVIGALVHPANLFVLAVCAGAVLLLTRWRRLGTALVVATALAALVTATTPLPQMAFTVLEDRFPVPSELPERVDGIVVLGGMVDLEASRGRGRPALTDTIERVIVGAELGRRYPQARLVFTGGSGLLLDQELREAAVIRPVFEQLGLPPQRVVYEDRSRDTYENAAYTAALVDPQPGETWILVTSAFHMPRAIGCFRRIGWAITPFPVDHRSGGAPGWWPPSFNFGRGLGYLQAAAHEWIGLLAYRISGRTDALFPRPDG